MKHKVVEGFRVPLLTFTKKQAKFSMEKVPEEWDEPRVTSERLTHQLEFGRRKYQVIDSDNNVWIDLEDGQVYSIDVIT